MNQFKDGEKYLITYTVVGSCFPDFDKKAVATFHENGPYDLPASPLYVCGYFTVEGLDRKISISEVKSFVEISTAELVAREFPIKPGRTKKAFTVNDLLEKLLSLKAKGYGESQVLYDDESISYCEYEENFKAVVLN